MKSRAAARQSRIAISPTHHQKNETAILAASPFKICYRVKSRILSDQSSINFSLIILSLQSIASLSRLI